MEIVRGQVEVEIEIEIDGNNTPVLVMRISSTHEDIVGRMSWVVARLHMLSLLS